MKLYSTDPNLPNFARAEYVAREPDLTLIADEMGGTRAMHARSTTYIRKWTAEKTAQLQHPARLRDVLRGTGPYALGGRRDAVRAIAQRIEWNQSEEVMTAHWDNIDGAGANGPVFVKRFAEAALRDGLALDPRRSSEPAGWNCRRHRRRGGSAQSAADASPLRSARRSSTGSSRSSTMSSDPHAAHARRAGDGARRSRSERRPSCGTAISG
jgi:hypothetical protein